MKQINLPNNRVLKIIQDSDFNPRVDQDNLGTIYSWHSRYALADKKDWKSKETFQLHKNDYISAKDAVESNTTKENVVIIPLYIYDHSGITISSSPFDCRFDSGQFGFITVTKEKLRQEFGCKRITKSIIQKAKEILESEIKAFDHYLTDNQYSFTIEENEESEGYFGPFHGENLYTNGMMDEFPLDVKEFLLQNKKEISVY